MNGKVQYSVDFTLKLEDDRNIDFVRSEWSKPRSRSGGVTNDWSLLQNKTWSGVCEGWWDKEIWELNTGHGMPD